MNLLFVILSIFSGSEEGDPLKKLLKQYNKETVPYIYVNEVDSLGNYHLLDSRETVEYDVSHLHGAQCVGYDSFNIQEVLNMVPNKQDTIVVYCSLGIRSEDIGEKLQEAGYTHVYNLYGGIFEWKNEEKEVYDSENEVTEEVHAFSVDWGKWLCKGVKIYK